jgi:hypothetical protein
MIYITRVLSALLLLTLINCEKPELNCDLKTIEAYAIKKCNDYSDNEECVSEVIYLITTSCGIEPYIIK